MKVEEIKKIAQNMGVPAVGPKAEMIKTIQRTEGNFDCFGTAVEGFCDHDKCMWRTDCLKPLKKSQ